MFLLAFILSQVRISDQTVFFVPIGALQSVQLRITPMGLKNGSDRERSMFCWTRLWCVHEQCWWNPNTTLEWLRADLWVSRGEWLWWSNHCPQDRRPSSTSSTSIFHSSGRRELRRSVSHASLLVNLCKYLLFYCFYSLWLYHSVLLYSLFSCIAANIILFLLFCLMVFCQKKHGEQD